MLYNDNVKQANTKSWRKTVVLLLTISILCSVFALFGATRTYRNRLEETYIRESENSCDKWITSTDTRLDVIHQQLHEIFLTLYNDKQYTKDINNIDAFTVMKIVDMLQNKVMASHDITTIFFYDINSDYFLVDNSKTLSNRLKSANKSFLRDECQSDQTYLTYHSWKIKVIEDVPYYYQSIRLGRFVLGAISDCSLYSTKNEGSEVSCYFMDEDILYYCDGDSELTSKFDLTNTRSRYEDNSIIVSATGEITDITGVMVVKPESFMNYNTISSLILLLSAIIGVGIIIVLYFYMKKNISKPTVELINATKEISKGDLDYRLDVNDAGSEEFEELYRNFNEMTSQITELKIESYDMKLNEEKNRLKMLRAQVRPHTFLNGITTISNLTYDDDPEKVRDYIYSFSQFARYMLHTDSEWISIIEEIEHIKNYVEMQKMRFPNSIEFTYNCDRKIENTQIPFLLMFSLVENSCKHVMDMVKTLNIHIDCREYEEENFKGILITVEDDGDGFPDDVLEKYSKGDINTKAHLGLTNVRYTLHLMYKRNDLLRLSNKPTGGAKVEMLIPEKEG